MIYSPPLGFKDSTNYGTWCSTAVFTAEIHLYVKVNLCDSSRLCSTILSTPLILVLYCLIVKSK